MRRVGFLFLIVLMTAAAVMADDDPFFPKVSYFKKHFATTPTKVELQPPARLADFVVAGKLELSLKAYDDLVMSNNPDISIQKLNIEYAQNAIMRAFGVF